MDPNTSLDTFTERAMARSGDVERAAMDAAVDATLRAFGALLGSNPEALAGLPRAVLSRVTGPVAERAPTPEAIYADVASKTDVRVGVALEMVQSAAAEVAGALTPAGRDTLRRALPEAWARLVVDPRPESMQPNPAHVASGA